MKREFENQTIVGKSESLAHLRNLTNYRCFCGYAPINVKPAGGWEGGGGKAGHRVGF